MGRDDRRIEDAQSGGSPRLPPLAIPLIGDVPLYSEAWTGLPPFALCRNGYSCQSSQKVR